MTFLIGLRKGEGTFFDFVGVFFNNDNCSKTKLLEGAKKCKLFDVTAQKKRLFIEVRENALFFCKKCILLFYREKLDPGRDGT